VAAENAVRSLERYTTLSINKMTVSVGIIHRKSDSCKTVFCVFYNSFLISTPKLCKIYLFAPNVRNDIAFRSPYY